MAAGIRAGWHADGGTLTVAGRGAEDCAPYDILINGNRTHRLPAAGAQHHEIVLDSLPPNSLVQLWLPHFGDFTLAQAKLDGATVSSAVEHGPRWTTYGSSITHCQQADGPTQAWPALVANGNGWRLSSLGLAGECQLDPVAADTIAQTPSDIISLCVGINSYNAAVFSERSYGPALQGFIRKVRGAHPDAPIAVITPVLSLPRENKPNAVGWTLADYRKATADVVAALQDAGDARLHLIKGARNTKAGEQFINTALTQEAASCLAGKLYLGPAVKGVEVSQEVARKLPWGAGGSIKDLRLFDWAQINAQRASVTNDWNRKVTAK